VRNQKRTCIQQPDPDGQAATQCDFFPVRSWLALQCSGDHEAKVEAHGNNHEDYQCTADLLTLFLLVGYGIHVMALI
jgi:hypothetical protein